MLYDQIIIAPGEDVSVVCIEAKAEYVAGMLAVHHAGLLLTHLRQYLIHVPEQHTLVVATCEGNQQSVIAGNRLSILPRLTRGQVLATVTELQRIDAAIVTGDVTLVEILDDNQTLPQDGCLLIVDAIIPSYQQMIQIETGARAMQSSSSFTHIAHGGNLL